MQGFSILHVYHVKKVSSLCRPHSLLDLMPVDLLLAVSVGLALCAQDLIKPPADNTKIILTQFYDIKTILLLLLLLLLLGMLISFFSKNRLSFLKKSIFFRLSNLGVAMPRAIV